MKEHIALIVMSEDEHKTPLYNSKLEALRWWEALNRKGKQRVLCEVSQQSISKEMTWDTLLTLYNRVHN